MPRLHGFLDLLGMRRGILLPVFSDPASHNHLLAQDVAADGTVRAFVKMVYEGRCDAPLPCSEEVDRRVGDDAWWGFLFQGETFQGSSGTIATTLAALARSGRIDPFPMTKVEVALLCRDDRMLGPALRDAYALLRSTSSWGARIWRDATILLPRVRRAADEWMRSVGVPPSPEELADVTVSGDEHSVRIGLPARMAARRIDRVALDGALVGTLSPILPCFDVVRASTFVQRDRRTAFRRPEPRGLVRGLGAIGLEVLGAKGAEAVARPGRAVCKPEAGAPETEASFGFVILPRLRARLDEAATMVEVWRRRRLVTVAIVVEAAGPSLAPEGRAAEVAVLREAFDYVVQVANHRLEASVNRR